MMASNLLKKVATRTKAIMRIHGGSYKAANKKAWSEYRAGKIGGTKKPKKKAARKKIVRKVKRLHAAEGKAIKRLSGVHSTFQAAAIGRLTTAQHLSHAREKIGMEIGRAEVSKFKAKTKRLKNKIAKRISALKACYRKLC